MGSLRSPGAALVGSLPLPPRLLVGFQDSSEARRAEPTALGKAGRELSRACGAGGGPCGGRLAGSTMGTRPTSWQMSAYRARSSMLASMTKSLGCPLSSSMASGDRHLAKTAPACKGRATQREACRSAPLDECQSLRRHSARATQLYRLDRRGRSCRDGLSMGELSTGSRQARDSISTDCRQAVDRLPIGGGSAGDSLARLLKSCAPSCTLRGGQPGCPGPASQWRQTGPAARTPSSAA